MILSDATSFLPEISLLFLLIIISLFRFFEVRNPGFHFIAFAAGLLVTTVFVVQQFYYAAHYFCRQNLSFDSLASLLKIFLLAGLASGIFISGLRLKLAKENGIITYIVLMFASFVSVSSNNILLTFACFELMNFCYLSILRFDPGDKSKQISLGSFYRSWLISSSLMLFGVSLLYGLFGSLNYNLMNDFLTRNPVNVLTLTITVLLVFSGFALKLFAFPLQSLLTNVFLNLNLSKLTIILTTSVIAGSGSLIRFVFRTFTDALAFSQADSIVLLFNWKLLLLIAFCLGVLTSAFLLHLQVKIRKSILIMLLINIQFLLIAGFECSSENIINFLINLFYVLCIIICSLIALRHIELYYLVKERKDVKGLFKVSKLTAFFLSAILLCNIGPPLTLGFITKLSIFSNFSQIYFLPAVCAYAFAVLASASFVYKIIVTGFSANEKTIAIIKMHPLEISILIILISAIFMFGIFPELLINTFQFIMMK